jgi:signal transduction histidine kinase
MPEGKITDLHDYLEKGARTIFKIYSLFSCLGYLVDIINFYDKSIKIVYNNSATISITIISYTLFYFKKLNLKSSFGIILYAALANVLIDSFTDPFSENRIYFFLRDSLFIIFLITLTALIIRKIHAIIIVSIYIIGVSILAIITKNDFLLNSLYLIILFVSVYGMVIYYFVNVVEHSIQERERNNELIREKNTIMNETNTILEERQQQLEEQSEEMAAQAEMLRIQSNELKQKNTELEQLNKTKDTFLSILAHDLKNPLNTIIGFAEILESRYQKITEEKKIHFIKIINTTSQKTYNLLENLLFWSRSQTNSIEYKPAQVSLPKIIKENLFFIQENAKAKKVSIRQQLDPNCIAFADENMVNTVVRNLLSNALKFNKIGGNIDVTCKNNNNEILIEVIDTGIGMSRENLENLFTVNDKFTRRGTSGEKGTGFGLLLCKDFIEKNGGKIWVSSESDIGTTLAFTLPAYEKSQNT